MREKGFAPVFILLGIVLVIALVGGGSFYLGWLSAPKPQQTTPPVVTFKSDPSPPDGNLNEIVGWKNYTNKEFKYSFMVPEKGYNVNLDPKLINKDNNLLSYSSIYYCPGEKEVGGNIEACGMGADGVAIYVYDSQKLELEDWLRQSERYKLDSCVLKDQRTKQKKTTYQGYESITRNYFIDSTTNSICPDFVNEFIGEQNYNFISKDGKIFVIHFNVDYQSEYHYSRSHDEIREEFNKIAASVKFLK